MSAPLLKDRWHQRLSDLRAGWDSYGAVPITPEALDTVGKFAVVPCSDGGVQLEIHQDGFDIEIEISPSGRIQAVQTGCAK